jgi:ATP-dependent DNA helicase RecQ
VSAQQLLSTIRQTGQVFGAGHIIDILRGVESQKILERRHHALATFGAGRAWPKDEWQAFIRQAVASGYLSINIHKYGGLEISRRGHALLSGNETFFYKQSTKVRPEKRTAAGKKRDTTIADGDAVLLSHLKKLRLGLARARNIPAYVVFPDSTLIEMARERPATLDQMSGISGVGPRKLKEFGPTFLRAIIETP